MSSSEARDCHVYVGTHAAGEDEGIRCYRLDGATGALSETLRCPLSDLPSFQALHPGGGRLYSANRSGGQEGRVLAFAIEGESGALSFINEQSSRGAGPCHVNVTGDGRHVLVANYGGGTVAVLPVGPDGSLGQAICVVAHAGSSVHPRQQAPHPHGIYASPDGRHVLVPDLGIDRVVVYRLGAGRLEEVEAGGGRVAAGAGPRHFAFHPAGEFGYVINELDSTVTAFRWHANRGELAELQTLSTLPESFDGRNTTAEIFVHPSGRWLYGSNRGHDSICIFAVDGETGRLSPAGNVPTGGQHPRYFGLDPSGSYLLAANMESDTIVSFRIEPATGLPEPTGAVVRVPAPVCAVMTPA